MSADTYTVTLTVSVPPGTPEEHVRNVASYLASVTPDLARDSGDWLAQVESVVKGVPPEECARPS